MNIHLKRVLILLLIFTFVFQMAGITSLQRVSAYADTEEALDAADVDQAEEEATAEDITDAYEETITEVDPPEVTEEPAEDPEAVPEEPAEAEVIEEAPAAPETITVEEPAEEPAAKAEAPVLRATSVTKAEKTGTVLAFSSDVHNKSGNVAANRLGTWIDMVKSKHGGIDVMAFGGDMANASASQSDFWTLTQSDMTVISNKGVTGVYTTGNHEYSPGSYSATSTNTTQKAYKINTEGAAGDDYLIYCLGSVSSSSSYSSQYSALDTYLKSAGTDKPIFIITHFPLHYYKGKYMERKTTDAGKVIEVLNDAVGRGQTIVYLWGHNHTESDTYYDQIYGPGSTIPTTGTNSGMETIQFYYGAAGCMSDSEYGDGSAYVKGKGLVVTITPNRGNATMEFHYYNEGGTDVTETESIKSVDVTIPEIPVTGVSIDEATGDDGQPVEKTTGAGGTIILNVTIEPANATNKSVTWSSSDTSVATVDENGIVKGVSAGTATITVTSNDTTTRAGFSASIDVRVAGTTYVLTDTLEGGTAEVPKEYLIATKNNGNLYVLNSDMNGVAKEAVNGEITITEDEAATIVFNCIQANSSDTYSTQLKLGDKYLYAASGNNGAFSFGLNTEPGDGKYWHYITNDGTKEKDLLWFFQDSKDTTTGTHGYSWAGSTYRYYLNYDANGSFTKGQLTSSTDSLAVTDTPKIFLFVKADETVVDATNVSLNETFLSVGEGSSETLTATVTPNTATTKQVLWTSSDPSVATVEDGVVTGVAEGTATITATTVNGQAVAECTVTVTSSTVPRYVLATSLEKDGKYLIVSANSGSAYALKNPGSAATISSNNGRTAVSINSGEYIETDATDIVWTADTNGNGFNLKNGNYFLEVSSRALKTVSTLSDSARYWTYNVDADTNKQQLIHKGGNSNYAVYYSSNTFTASSSTTNKVYLFKLQEEDVAVSGVTLDKATAEVPVNGTTQLTATVAPTNATNKKVSWTSSDNTIATVDATGKVTGVAPGEATITVTTEDGGFHADCVVTVSVVNVSGVSITPSSTSVAINKTTQLTANVSPENATNKNITWESSDTSIATVDNSGKVTGVAIGNATITATTEDGNFTASSQIKVVEKQYYVITIDNYALSYHASSEMLSNSSGYEYHGLQTATYDASQPAPYDILWTIEPVDGTENGYYIKNYNGKYLSGSYVKNDTAYTGTLAVGDTPDIWVITDGLEAWQGDGSYLKSTNGSDNPRPADIYLTYRASNNSVDFFTVGSSSNYKTSKLIEPTSIKEPIAVTGINLDPTALEIEAGKTAPITVNVLPADADDKTVAWISSNESVATVSNDGRVKGIAAGTATITATTNDGGFTATCEVTVTPSAAPGIGYVITIDGYALSVEPSSDTLINSSNYYYRGLAGVKYTDTTELTNDILWLIEPHGEGYYIMSQDGRYLNAVYEATTNPTGCNAELKLDDTPDVWTFADGKTLIDWVVSGSTLSSTNSGKSMTYEEGSTSSPLNLFTIRSTGESSSMIDPDNTAEVRFVETNAFKTNGDYIIAVTKDGSNVYAIENTSGSISADTGSATLTVNPAGGNDAAYIVTDNDGVVWTYDSSKYLVNSTRYLSRGGSSGAYVPRSSGSGSAVTYDSSNKRLSISYSSGWGSGTTYYLTNTNGTFGLNTSSSSAAQVRLFEKASVFNFKYVVQFVSNGVNYQSSKYAEGEVPAYTGSTPTRAETAQYTYTFSGWSADGGTTLYGPDDTLPAVTRPVTYVAQFTAVPKPTGHTVTFETNGGTVVEPQTVADGGTATRPENDPTKEGCYKFDNWYSDEDLTSEYNFETAVTADITIYAGWVDDHTLTKTEEKTATCIEAGNSAYWTCSVCGKFFSDAAGATEIEEGSWVISATGHNPGEAVHENEVAATCTTTGSYDEVIYCSVCEAEISREAKTTPALGHNMTAHAAVAATCIEAGNSAYWSCDRCDGYFGDADGNTVINENSWVISATGHNPGEAVHEHEVAATCTTSGSYDEVVYCSVCEAEISREAKTTPALGHNMTAHAAIAATCIEAGNSAYWSCDRCGGYFGDADGNTVINENSWVIDATGHNPGEAVHEHEVAATCTTTGSYDEVIYCSVCEAEISREAKTTPALGHNMTAHAAVAATCTEAGNSAYWSCDRCDGYFGDAEGTATIEANSWIISALGHSWGEWTIVTPATEESDGLEERVCLNDPEHKETRAIPALGHIHNMQKVDKNDAACEETGNIEYWVCTKCNNLYRDEAATQQITEADTVIAALGHNFGEWTETTAPTCTTDGEETRSCSRCNTTETRTVDALGHNIVHHDAQAATCTEIGWEAYDTCLRCDYTTYKEIAALEHDWQFVNFTWTGNDENGYTKAVANYRCKNDNNHNETVEVAVTVTTTAATCTVSGSTVYSATVTEEASLDGVERTGTKTVVLPAPGHDWEFLGFTWTGSDEAGYTAAVANYKCKNDETHTDTVTATVTPVTTPATCETAGSTVYTAVVTAEASLDNAAHENAKTVTINASGHSWGTPVWEWIGNDEDGYTGIKGTFTCQNDSSHVETVETTNINVVRVEPTPTTAGSITYSANVTGPDGVVYSKDIRVVIPPAGYTFKNPVYTWTATADGYSVTALKECNEDTAQNITETVTATYAVTTPATCEAAGTGTYTAAFTKTDFTTQTKEVTIDALTHNWEFVNFTWVESGEGYAAVANYKCKNDADHTRTANGTVTSATTAATCEAAGSTVYTATIAKADSLDGEAHEGTKTVAIAALNHDWNEPTCEWNTDHTSVTATFTCKRDTTHTETVTASGDAITSAVTTEPTASTPGVRTYTATVTLDGKTYTLTDTEAIPATGNAVTGNITSFKGRTEEGQVTVELFADGSETAAYTATVTVNTSYAFEGVADGTYTMKVSKKDHVTRSYEITLAGSAVTQDVKIHLIGDINGDGKISMLDVGPTNQHVRELRTLTGYEFDCADVNSDGKLSMIDVGQINQHARELRFLW